MASDDPLRDAWSKWGKVEDDVLTHLINPMFMGGPRWPGTRQAYRIARSGGSTLVASDGLSDAYDEGEGPKGVNGLGLEVYAISSDAVPKVAGSWLFDLVWNAAQLCASNPGIGKMIDDLGLISTELYDVKVPPRHAKRFVNDEGRVGVLVGQKVAKVPESAKGALSKIRLVNLQLLTLEELAFIVDGGEKARGQLAMKLDGITSLERASVVPAKKATKTKKAKKARR